MAKKVNVINYNNEALKEGEVLVKLPLNELYAQENITNPDCTSFMPMAGKRFGAMHIAVPKEFEKLGKAQMNYDTNEKLGHYSQKNTDDVDWNQDEKAQALYTTPSAEDVYFAQALGDENIINFKRRMKSIIEKAPRVGYAMLIIMEDPSLKGERFYTKMRLGRSEASKIEGVAKKCIHKVLHHKDVELKKMNKTRKDDFYRNEADRLIDVVVDMIW